MDAESSISTAQEPQLASETCTFEPPNGGTKAWACVAGGMLLQFCSFGYVNAYVMLSSKDSLVLTYDTGVGYFLTTTPK